MARKEEMGVQVRSHTQDEDLVRLYLDNIGKYALLTQDEESGCQRSFRKVKRPSTNWREVRSRARGHNSPGGGRAW